MDLNLIDGSAIWLQSVVRLFNRIPKVEVTVQLKRDPQREVLIGPLRDLDRVHILPQPKNEGRRLLPERAPRVLGDLDSQMKPFDVVLLRGYRLCLETARHGQLAGRMWCYLTDFPQHSDELSDVAAQELSEIAAASRYLLCQTDELRSFLETYVPDSRGRTALLRPVVDEMPDNPPRDLGRARGARIIYSGKFAPRWRTEELLRDLAAIREDVPEAEVVVVGDKVHDVPDDPGFADRMRSALQTTEGVTWLGARPRAEVHDILSTADFGYSIRDPSLDASLELSTKVLEYGRAGVPPLLSRTPMHERLLGSDYPLFIASEEPLGLRLRQVLDDPGAYRRAAEAAWSAAGRHSEAVVARELEFLLDRACPDPAIRLREQRHVLVAGHDLKFTGPIVDHLAALPEVDVRVEQWDGLDSHDEKVSRANLAWADAILAEWCLGNVVWFARHRSPDQRLVTRFHLFERDTPYPLQLRDGDVDGVRFVGRHILQEMSGRMSLSAERLDVIPNAVPAAPLRRPKLPGARFNLGIIGISPWRKRFDLAVETLRRVRAVDDRFVLFVKGQLPTEYWWIWGKERERYLAVADSVASDESLKDAVIFDGFGSDVAEWLRKVGFVLSPSDFESYHLAVAEGRASGAVPVIWDWAGAGDIYPDEQLVTSADEAAAAILEAADSAENREREENALRSVGDPDLVDVCRAWERVLLA